MNLQEIKEAACRLSGEAETQTTRDLAFVVQMLAHRVEEIEMDVATKQDDPEYAITAEQAEEYIREVLADFPLGNGKSKLRLASELCDMLKPYLHNANSAGDPPTQD